MTRDPSRLGIGDFVPPFALRDQGGTVREIQNYGGRRTVLFFFPANNDAFVAAFLKAIEDQLGPVNWADFHRVNIFASEPPVLKALEDRLDFRSLLWADEKAGLYKAFGFDPHSDHGVAVVASHNLKVQAIFPAQTGDAMLQAVLDYYKTPVPKQEVFDGRRRHAPIMMIPEAITKELCQELMAYWEAGNQYQGTLGAGGGEKVVLSGKRRIDVDITDRGLLERIDYSLSKSVFPEIQKVACVTISHRERYKIGGYFAEHEGFYNQHRDTGHHLAYRRYSISIGLSDDYEGGYLEFPEYDFAAYKLLARAALVFPSTLLHQITPVKAGKRFVMVSFMYSEAENAIRRQITEAEGKTFDDSDQKLLARAHFDDIPESQYLYTHSLKK